MPPCAVPRLKLRWVLGCSADASRELQLPAEPAPAPPGCQPCGPGAGQPWAPRTPAPTAPRRRAGAGAAAPLHRAFARAEARRFSDERQTSRESLPVAGFPLHCALLGSA